MIKIINQYDLENHFEETGAHLNELIEDGYTLWATLNGWGATEDYQADGCLILYKPDAEVEAAEHDIDEEIYRDMVDGVNTSPPPDDIPF